MEIVVHSTGADNPNLKRYVNAPGICGENPYKNYFDRPDIDGCPHADEVSAKLRALGCSVKSE